MVLQSFVQKLRHFYSTVKETKYYRNMDGGNVISAFARVRERSGQERSDIEELKNVRVYLPLKIKRKWQN